MRKLTVIAVSLACLGATQAVAEYDKIDRREDFVSIVQGKALKRPFVNIEVTESGEITGTGAAWPVTGSWSWEDGYFCRDLFWGGDPLGYNCQRVDVRTDGRIRFTSDRGAGDSAEFRLR